MRDTFARTLLELARDDSRVMLLTGDLGFGVLTAFEQELPRQYLNVGIAEQNLACVAAGLALEGHRVFMYSIANFPTLRCLEQIRNDICYHNLPVTIVGVGAGFSYGTLGISHYATEDLAVIRALPEMTVLSPADLWEAEHATRAAYESGKPCYLRIDKSRVQRVLLPPRQFQIGRARLMRDGADATIVGTGGVLEEALNAADLLSEIGIECAVLGMPSIKPVDNSAIVDAARRCPVMVTLEEHTIDGGLGSIVAEVCADAGVHPRVLRRLGVRSGFSTSVGSQAYLRRCHGLDASAVFETVRSALAGLGVQTLAHPRGMKTVPVSIPVRMAHNSGNGRKKDADVRRIQ